jgi:hypothetical protein
MRKLDGVLMRQLAAALVLSALAIAAMLGAIGPAGAADLPGYTVQVPPPNPYACGGPREEVVLFKEHGIFPRYEYPTVPARTPYYTCVTGQVLVPGDIPPPPEYCCG